MPKIALMKISGGGYYEDYSEIIQKVSDWEEVTVEELALMKSFYRNNEGYTIIEFVDNQQDKIDFAVKSQLEYIKQEELKKQEEKEKWAGKLAGKEVEFAITNFRFLNNRCVADGKILEVLGK